MRLWSIHPSQLDCRGFVGLWRESLLAKDVLLGRKTAYRNHPQLNRFKNSENPVLFIKNYLAYLYIESVKRGYNFNSDLIEFEKETDRKINTNDKQILYEFKILKEKLFKRDINKYNEISKQEIKIHPIFNIVDGEIESWEKIK